MKNNSSYFTLVAIIAGGLIVGGCGERKVTEEVDGQPVKPGGDTNAPVKPKPKPKPQPKESTEAPPKQGPAGKYTIKEIMQEGFKKEGSLKSLVLDGKATDEQKAKFVDYVENLAKYKVRKGEQEEFEKRVGTLIAAAKGTDLAALDGAVNCKSCHTPHKIYPQKKK